MAFLAPCLLLLARDPSAAETNAAALDVLDRRVFVSSETHTTAPYDERVDTTVDYGSGFVISSGNQLLFVTAKHVARKTNPQTKLSFRTTLGISHFARLFGLTAPDEKNPWRMHAKADLALFRIVFFPKFDEAFRNEIRGLAIPDTLLGTNTVARGRRVEVCGFPRGFGTLNEISPLVTTAFVASREMLFNLESVNTPMFLVTPAIGAGCSGGPAFLTNERGEPEELVGMYVATYPDNTGGKLSSLVPARQILELIKETTGGEAGGSR
jgi:hypothetical protein